MGYQVLRLVLSGGCVLSAVALAYNGYDGWGWFLFVALCFCPWESFE